MRRDVLSLLIDNIELVVRDPIQLRRTSAIRARHIHDARDADTPQFG
jgi:hypothetical protein